MSEAPASPPARIPATRNAQIALVAAHIDAAFYAAQLPDLAPGDAEAAAAHYCETGWRQGLDPAPDFSTRGYLALHPDIRKAGLNPFLHWLAAGRAEGRRTLRAGAPLPEAAAESAGAAEPAASPAAPAVARPVRGFATAGQRDAFLLALQESGLFDPVFYAARNPAAASDPFGHFAETGLDAQADPCALFSCRFYLATHADIRAAGMHPLLHYLYWGGAEKRQPHPLVAPAWLAGRIDATDAPHGNLLAAYAALRRRLPPRPILDLDHLTTALELPPAGTGWEVARAFLLAPPARRPDPSPLFRGAFVARHHPERGGEDPLGFYLARRGEGVAPHPLFDNNRVHAQNILPWPSPLGLSQLEVFLEDPPPTLSTHALFDAEFYLREAGEALPRGRHPLLHYVSGGWRAGFRPNPWFDSLAYAARYMEKAPPEVSPLEHYLEHGREPWMDLSPDFAQIFYVTRYPNIASDYPRTPLEHFIEHGRFEGRLATGTPPWQDDFADWEEVARAVRAGFATAPEAPEVSVIIPVYNQFSHTLRCLWSILKAGDATPVEVILADDGSTDDTAAFFRDIPGITHLRNPENLGFLRNCNRAAAAARGRLLYFLNNDTAVLPGWVDRLVETFARHPEAGLVGAKLVYPQGTLQEAGGHVWADGNAANAGRNSDPEAPAFNWLRDVDYVSGAAIMVPRALWERLGGFDETFAPAYWEDTDLAFRIRQRGWRVLCQPRAQVVHFEGVSSGRDLTQGVKAHQVTNGRRFRESWAFALERQPAPRIVTPENLPRPRRPRILVIDAITPTPDRDSGSVSAFWFLKILTGLGYDVTFIPDNLQLSGRYGHALQELGVEVLHGPQIPGVERWLRQHARDFDLFFLYRVTAGGKYATLLRALAPQVPIVFDTVDLHYLRAEREARLPGAPADALEAAAELKARELGLMAMATDTILVSTAEREILRAEGVTAPVSVIALVLEPRPAPASRAGREGLAFVGGYRHTPNVDAVLWFVEEIWPLLRAEFPDLTLHVAGSHPPPEIENLDAPGVVVHGHVPDLPAFLGARIATIAPLRYGAGVKGKVGSSLAEGVPCIASPIAAEGMGLSEDREILIAETPGDWLRQVGRILSDEALWQRLSDAGRAFVAREYAPAVARGHLIRVLAKTDTAPFSGICPISGMREARRFLSLDDPDSLVAGGAGGSTSSERVLAAAIAAALGAPGRPLARLAGQERLRGAVRIAPDLPRLAEACAGSGLAGTAGHILAARLMPGDVAGLGTLLAGAEGVTRLALAVPAGGRVGEPAPDPAGIADLVDALLAAGWQVRTDRFFLPECALTRVVLVEARRPRAARAEAAAAAPGVAQEVA